MEDVDALWPLDCFVVVVSHRPRTALMAEPIVAAPSPGRSVRPRGSPEPVALAGIPLPGRWSAHAACRGMDTEAFFPHRGQKAVEAMAVCETCPVRIPCGEYAIEVGAVLQGVWGELNERDRRRTRRQRRREEAS